MTILVTRLQESIFELLMIEHSDFKIGIFIETLVIPCNSLYNSYNILYPFYLIPLFSLLPSCQNHTNKLDLLCDIIDAS